MHAYDLGKLVGGLTVRYAQQGESLTLLDGRAIQVDADMVVIADEQGAVGLGGVMGGARTAVTPDTRDVYFEAAYFTADAILGRARRIGLVTDAAQRFERGVDPTQQGRAIERAVGYLAGFAGGRRGRWRSRNLPRRLPKRAAVSAARQPPGAAARGRACAGARGERHCAGLGMQVSGNDAGWTVVPPAHRFDISDRSGPHRGGGPHRRLRCDPGDRRPRRRSSSAHCPRNAPPSRRCWRPLRPAATRRPSRFAFVDPALQGRCSRSPGSPWPIRSPVIFRSCACRCGPDWSRQRWRINTVSRGGSACSSTARVSSRARAATREIDSLAARCPRARACPEQWGIGKAERVRVDFYDVKADLAALLAATGDAAAFTFETGSMPALHPGRTARVLRRGVPVGWLGELHPTLTKSMDFTYPPVLFELDAAALGVRRIAYQEISRFPQVRRDLAVVVDEAVTLSTLTERVTLVHPACCATCGYSTFIGVRASKKVEKVSLSA